jgi:hypothetical protein
LRNKPHKEQQGRFKAAKKLLKEANCGEITVEGKTVKVRVAACGMLYGMGKNRSLRINPLDVQMPAAETADVQVAAE